jgi:transcriptional regulator with XRE-family HTH domain
VTVQVSVGRSRPLLIASRTIWDSSRHSRTGTDVDDAPYIKDLDLASVATHEELAAFLRAVHLIADRPSLRALESRTRHDATPLSKTALSEMLRGVRFPRKAVMVAFLQACGVQGDHMEPWRRTWERIAANELGRARPVTTGSASVEQTPVAAGRLSRSNASPQDDLGDTHERAVSGGRSVALSVAAETVDAAPLREQITKLSADNARLRRELAARDRRHVGQEPHLAGMANARSVHSPTACRRELGILLRTLRQEKGLTIDYVAEHLDCSPSKVSHMETSSRAGTIPDVRDLCDLYGVTDETERERMLSLAREGKKTGWWQGYDLDYFATYVGLEAGAATIKYYQSAIVPGLMQTQDYSRAMHEAGFPKIAPERIDELIEVRLTRQRLLLEESPVRLEALLDEAVLHRMVGGSAVMRAQLNRIIELAGESNVTMQVIPYTAGAHPAMDSSFNVLEFAGSVPSVVYVEGLIGWIYVERPQDVERYQQIYEHLHTVASSPRDSVEILAEISTQYKN